MNIKQQSIVSGKIDWLEVRDKNGKVKHRLENIPNIVFNLSNIALGPGPFNTHYAMESNAEVYADLDGTWNQSGNTITRATGSGTFPTSPDQLGNELYWYDAGANTGHRCHVTARTSDTSITVSGVAKSITGGKIRRFHINQATGSVTSSTGFKQSSASVTNLGVTYNYTTDTITRTCRANFNSATTGYNLGSIIISACARVKLPAIIVIDAEDQLTYQYKIVETCTGKSQDYELGAESVGIPQKHSMLSIVGNGSYVDVTFSAATHFLAGDKLDLRGVITKKVAISSASSTSTTFTINTATAHSLNPGDSVTIENASLAGYNGVHTVATTPTGTQFTITNAANPGAMGAAGTARLTNPSGYFDTLGLATIASMQSGGTVARITSAITGQAVEPVMIGGDPGVKVRFWPKGAAVDFDISWLNVGTSYSGMFTEANAKAIADPTTPSVASTTGIKIFGTTIVNTDAARGNDYTFTRRFELGAGVGTDITRCKQILLGSEYAPGHQVQITFNTPFNKTTSQRIRLWISKQIKRTLDLTGLP